MICVLEASSVVKLDNAPLGALMLLTENPVTASVNTIVRVAVSLTFNAVSLMVKDITSGGVVSIVKLALVYEDAGLLSLISGYATHL